MKIPHLIPTVLAASLGKVTLAVTLAATLVACQNSGKDGGQGSQAAGKAAQPQPGMQPGQGQQMAAQNGQGSATALGNPGAGAAQAEGQPNLQAGQQLATAGAPNNGVTACVGCHGAQGEGNAAAGFPRIAGQAQAYLSKQLGAYANGARVNPIMQPIAKGMSAEQIRDVSAYYASLGDAPDAVASSAGTGTKAGGKGAGGSGDRGRLLSEVGDDSKGVQACANCHGPGGLGKQPAYPYLAGQHASYMTAAMGEWKNGSRKTDPSGQMPHVAMQLADADVTALSAYFSAQPAPPSAAKMVNIPAGSSQRPTVAAAAGAPGPHTPGGSTLRGTGTEQGAPTTGGAQGPGGGGGALGNQPQNETPSTKQK
jgi:cytochrome c553